MDTVAGLTEVVRAETDVSFKLTFHKARERTPANRKEFDEINIALINDRWECAAVGTPSGHITPLAMKYYEALCEAIAGGTEKMFGRPAAAIEDWRVTCVKKGLIDKNAKPDSARSLFSKYKLELIAANRIACNDTMAWSIV